MVATNLATLSGASSQLKFLWTRRAASQRWVDRTERRAQCIADEVGKVVDHVEESSGVFAPTLLHLPSCEGSSERRALSLRDPEWGFNSAGRRRWNISSDYTEQTHALLRSFLQQIICEFRQDFLSDFIKRKTCRLGWVFIIKLLLGEMYIISVLMYYYCTVVHLKFLSCHCYYCCCCYINYIYIKFFHKSSPYIILIQKGNPKQFV